VAADHVPLENELVGGLQGGAYGAYLYQNVFTFLSIIDHALDATNLAFDALHAREYVLFDPFLLVLSDFGVHPQLLPDNKPDGSVIIAEPFTLPYPRWVLNLADKGGIPVSGTVINVVDEQIYLLNTIELLAAVFRGPDRDGWSALLEAGLPELAHRAPERFGDLTATLGKLQDAVASGDQYDALVDELQIEHVRLFVAGRGGVVAPPYESCHQGDTPAVMTDVTLAMRDRLADAGLEISLTSNEPPDHIALELEFLYLLLVSAWPEEDAELEAEARAFAGETMLPWVSRFREAIMQGKPHPVFAHSADMAVELLKSISG